MEPKTKFKIKTFFYYLVVEPWTEKISLPNFRSVSWVLIFIAVFFRFRYLLLISIILGLTFHLISEFRSGKFIYWYRQRKFGEQREALKKIKEERKNENSSDKSEYIKSWGD